MIKTKMRPNTYLDFIIVSNIKRVSVLALLGCLGCEVQFFVGLNVKGLIR